MLLDDDVVADGKAKSGALSGRFGREERVEHLFFHVRRHTAAVVADSDFHAIAEVFGRGCEGWLVTASINLCSAPGRSIEAICNQIKKSSPDVLRENVCPTGRRIKELLELDLKTLRLGPRSMPCEIEAFLNERIDIDHPMLTRAFARVQQHILDDGIRASAMMDDLVEIALQRVGQFVDFSAGFIVEWHDL